VYAALQLIQIPYLQARRYLPQIRRPLPGRKTVQSLLGLRAANYALTTTQQPDASHHIPPGHKKPGGMRNFHLSASRFGMQVALL